MQKCVIGISINGIKKIEQIKPHIKKLSQLGELLSLSSVYSDKQNPNLLSIGYNYKICGAINTKLDAKQVLSFLKQSEADFLQMQLKEELKFYLLFYESQISVLPSLSLPHPNLHKADDWLSPSAEICPDYVHPIFDQRLEEISRASLSNMQSQFIAQSKSLLDF